MLNHTGSLNYYSYSTFSSQSHCIQLSIHSSLQPLTADSLIALFFSSCSISWKNFSPGKTQLPAFSMPVLLKMRIIEEKHSSLTLALTSHLGHPNWRFHSLVLRKRFFMPAHLLSSLISIFFIFHSLQPRVSEDDMLHTLWKKQKLLHRTTNLFTFPLASPFFFLRQYEGSSF